MSRYASCLYLVFALFQAGNVGCADGDGSPTPADVDRNDVTAELRAEPGEDASASLQPTSKKGLEATTTEAQNLRQLARKALDAYGGDEIFSRLQRGRLTMDVTGNFIPGVTGEATIIDTFDGPGRFRRETEGTVAGETVRMTFVLNGNVGWVQTPGKEARSLPVYQASHQVNILLASFKNLKAICDGEFSLKRVSDERDSGVTAVEFSSDEGQVGTIEFGRKEHFLVASHKSFYDPRTATMASLTTYYSEHKAVDGMTIPTRIVAYRDGELFLDTTIRKLELLESVDPALFMKPEDE